MNKRVSEWTWKKMKMHIICKIVLTPIPIDRMLSLY